MIQRIIIILILASVISSCGAAAATQLPATEAPVGTEVPVQPLVAESSPTAEPAETSTPQPTPTEIAPTPTDTQLPALQLPTEAVNAPVKMVWDGAPTYLGDSQPGYSFRVTYDPDLWALTTDQFGFPAIGHRGIPYCVIAPTSGRGLSPSITVEHDILYFDKLFFEVNTASENGERKFVTYIGGDGTIFTGFEVTFAERADECIADAVAVLSTLKSVPVSQATPQP